MFRSSKAKWRSIVNGAVHAKKRASVAILRCEDGLINLERGGAAPGDLHFPPVQRRADQSSQRAGFLGRTDAVHDACPPPRPTCTSARRCFAQAVKRPHEVKRLLGADLIKMGAALAKKNGRRQSIRVPANPLDPCRSGCVPVLILWATPLRLSSSARAVASAVFRAVPFAKSWC